MTPHSPAFSLSTTVEPAEASAACISLARALAEDPFYQAVSIGYAADPARREQVLGDYFALALDEGRAVGEVWFAGADGAAIWITNEAPASERATHSAIRTERLAKLLGPEGFNNYQSICQSMERQVPESLHDAWYLSILGVRPEARGQGLAQRLLKPTLARADASGVACFLETFNPLSLPFYRRLGFVHEVALMDEVTSRPYWLMSRPASDRE